MNVGENVEKKKPLYTLGRNVMVVWLLWKTVWKFFRKLKLSYSSMPEYISRKNENTKLKRHHHPDVCLYYSWDMEAT